MHWRTKKNKSKSTKKNVSGSGSNKRYTRECEKSGDLNNNVEHKTRSRNEIQEQIEGDHEKVEQEYEDENEDSEELDNRSESVDSLD